MIWLIVVMCIWILLLTAAVVGMLFRQNELDRALAEMYLETHDKRNSP